MGKSLGMQVALTSQSELLFSTHKAFSKFADEQLSWHSILGSIKLEEHEENTLCQLQRCPLCRMAWHQPEALREFSMRKKHMFCSCIFST